MPRGQRIGNRVALMPPFEIGWLLLASALSLPWLMPIHTLPWTGFHADALMALVVMVTLAFVLLRTPGPWVSSRSCGAIIGLSFVPPLQYLAGVIHFAADAFLAGACLLALGFTVLLGRRIETCWPGRLVPTVFASFGIAACISFAIALNQWFQLDQWGNFTIAISAGSRPVANVAQPNKLATLYVWGLVALWWISRAGLIRGWLTLLCAALLLLGIAMTQSRMGAIAVVAVTVASFFHAQALDKKMHRWMLIGLFIWFLVWALSWSALNTLHEAVPLGSRLDERLVPGTRLLHWQLIVDAILQRPFVGWGWQQVSVAQSTLALAHPATGEVIRSSHNLVLDLLLWNGLPLGLLVTFGIFLWYAKHWRDARGATELQVMMVLSVFLLHSMLEQPHTSLTFLLPAGLLAGTLSVSNTKTVQSGAWSIRVVLVSVAVLMLLAGLLLVARDYFKIEAAWMAERLRVARIGSVTLTPLPRTRTLEHLSAVLETGRIEPRGGMGSEEIEAIRRISYRMPGVGAMLKLAEAQALNGQSEEAAVTLARLCRTHPEATCDGALAAWSKIVDGKNQGVSETQ